MVLEGRPRAEDAPRLTRSKEHSEKTSSLDDIHLSRHSVSQAEESRHKKQIAETNENSSIFIESLAGNPGKISEAIIDAIKEDDAEKLELVLNLVNFANIIQEDHCRRTPIWHAAFYGSSQCLEVFRRHLWHRPSSWDYCYDLYHDQLQKAISLPSKWGTSPLLIAAIKNHPDAVSLLITMGASPDTVNSYNTSVALLAAHAGHVPVLHALHSYNAKMDLSNNLGMTPALAAAKNGNVDVLKYLHCHAKINFRRRDGSGYNGLDCAAIACFHNQPSVIKYLLSITQPDNPMLPDFNLKFGRLNDTPLHIATRGENIEALATLLKSTNCCDIHEMNGDGMTALHLAAHLNLSQVVECFWVNLDLAAFLSLTRRKDSVNNVTPLVHAMLKGHMEMVSQLAPISDTSVLCEMVGSDIPSPVLVIATARNDLKMVEALLKAGVDIDQTDEKGHTSISTAAKNGSVEICDLLARRGADLSKVSHNSGRTPLQKARKYKQMQVVEILEKFDAY